MLEKILNVFHSHRIKNIKNEIKEKEKLCETQATLNTLLAEEKLIEEIPSDQKIESTEDLIPETLKYIESN